MIELQDLLEATGGRLHGAATVQQFADFAFDSRRLGGDVPPSRGPLFVAVKSDTGDGHDYILDAVHKGATGVLCQRVPVGLAPSITCVVVDDTRQALWDWARLALQKADIPIVAVTGSRGKTITKEAIAAVLSRRYSVFKSPRSYSGRYGLPIALGRLERRHEIGVLELAADSLDEIYDLARLTHPTVGVITSIGQAHIDTLGSIEAIEREKAHLLEALPPDGLAILNRDDERTWHQRTRTRARIVSYGMLQPGKPPPNVAAHDLCFDHDGMSFVLAGTAGSEWADRVARLQLLGRHHVYAALAALAVGRAYGVPVPEALDVLERLLPLPGRLRSIPACSGALLVDDSYDAELDCTLAALDALIDHYASSRRIVVLAGVGQPGLDGEAMQCIARRAAKVADELVLKGEHAQALRSTAPIESLSADRVFVTYTNREATRHLLARTGPGDVVLIKGTREERLEEIVRELMADPGRAPELLIRQEPAFRGVQLALPERPTVLKVNLEAIANNLRTAQRIVGDRVRIMAVLKADGYGHGAIRIARTAMNNGAYMLGVACLSEGIALRQAGLTAPILVLGYTPAWHARQAVLYSVTCTVFDLDTVAAFSRAAAAVGRTARLHVKIDTGMGRLGLLADEALPFLLRASRLPNIKLEGIFTHFSVADEADKSYTRLQIERFRQVLDQARRADVSFSLVHAANSAALLTLPEARFDMVRLGIALYGLAPSRDTPLPAGFEPALTFETRVAQVKTLPPGSFVSYGNTYRTHDEETIAVIPVGYADGFRRAPRHWQYVLVRGQRAPIVGRVCMDQTMINVTHIPGVRQGDPVVLIGRQGDEVITVEQIAANLGTINYEVISEILARVPRVS